MELYHMGQRSLTVMIWAILLIAAATLYIR
jgi:hypothetical protein